MSPMFTLLQAVSSHFYPSKPSPCLPYVHFLNLPLPPCKSLFWLLAMSFLEAPRRIARIRSWAVTTPQQYRTHAASIPQAGSCFKRNSGIQTPRQDLPTIGQYMAYGNMIPSGTTSPSWQSYRPDHCDGTYDSYCDPNRQYKNITAILQAAGATDLLAYMNVYWKDNQGNDESFWEHEWGKHGTCISTLDTNCYTNYTAQQEVVDYFTKTVDLFKHLDSYAVSLPWHILVHILLMPGPVSRKCWYHPFNNKELYLRRCSFRPCCSPRLQCHYKLHKQRPTGRDLVLLRRPWKCTNGSICAVQPRRLKILMSSYSPIPA